MADTHCVMSGAVTECLIRTGRETISLSWTAVVSVARRSVGSIGRPQGARVTRFRSWHSGDEAAGWAEEKVTLIKLSLRRGKRKKNKTDSFSHRSVRGVGQAGCCKEDLKQKMWTQSLHTTLQSLENSEFPQAWSECLVGCVCILNVIRSSSRLNLNNFYWGVHKNWWRFRLCVDIKAIPVIWPIPKATLPKLDFSFWSAEWKNVFSWADRDWFLGNPESWRE